MLHFLLKLLRSAFPGALPNPVQEVSVGYIMSITILRIYHLAKRVHSLFTKFKHSSININENCMFACLIVTSSLLSGLSDKKTDETIKIVRVQGRSLCSLELHSGWCVLLFTKLHLFSGTFSKTFTKNKPIFLFMLICAQIIMLFMCILVSFIQKSILFQMRD